MDGAIDVKLLLTLAGMLVSVVAAGAVAKREIKLLSDQTSDIEQRLRKLDQRVDKLENTLDTTQHRLGILASMSSPDTQERRHREIERLRVDVDYLKGVLK
jgi:DNA anti-recombination protein RmuC